MASRTGRSLITVVLENFEANPFLRLFYTDPPKYSFETEISFLLQHLNAIKALSPTSNWLVCDFSFLLDKAFADVTLDAKTRKTFLAVHSRIMSVLGPPDLVIHLQCRPTHLLNRIKQRGREVEKGIESGYLLALDKSIRCNFKELKNSVKALRIDSTKYNFAKNIPAKQQVFNIVLKSLGS